MSAGDARREVARATMPALGEADGVDPSLRPEWRSSHGIAATTWPDIVRGKPWRQPPGSRSSSCHESPPRGARHDHARAARPQRRTSRIRATSGGAGTRCACARPVAGNPLGERSYDATPPPSREPASRPKCPVGPRRTRTRPHAGQRGTRSGLEPALDTAFLPAMDARLVCALAQGHGRAARTLPPLDSYPLPDGRSFSPPCEGSLFCRAPATSGESRWNQHIGSRSQFAEWGRITAVERCDGARASCTIAVRHHSNVTLLMRACNDALSRCSPAPGFLLRDQPTARRMAAMAPA